MLGFRVRPGAVSSIAIALVALGCSAGAASQSRSNPGAGGSANVDGDGGEPVPASLSFSIRDTLKLSPSDEQMLEVVAEPAGYYHVQFALLGADLNDGPSDAALDRSEADTDADGVAHVQLTAPSTPAIFTVKASVGMAVNAELAVSVSGAGYGALRVEPIYSGKRNVSEWFASVRDGQSCDEFSEMPAPDGALHATAPKDEFPVIEDVPVGAQLAVIVRAGHYISGCATLGQIDAGETTVVPVSITDRPIDLDGTQLDVALGFDEPSPEWNLANDQAITAALAAFSGSSEDDVTLLLDTMQAEAGVAAFATARNLELWDDSVRERWGDGASTRLRDAARRWLEQGSRSLVGSDVILGRLGPDEGDAELVLSSVAGHPPKEVGFTPALYADWSADTSDTLFLGTSLLWVPSKLLTTLALEPAVAELAMADSAPGALGLVAGCAELASDLVDLGAIAGEAYASCNVDCVQELCETALTTLWDRARDSGTTTPLPATLAVTASGAVTVGDDATAVRLEGSWVGQLQSGPSAATAGGELTAVEHSVP